MTKKGLGRPLLATVLACPVEWKGEAGGAHLVETRTGVTAHVNIIFKELNSLTKSVAFP